MRPPAVPLLLLLAACSGEAGPGEGPPSPAAGAEAQETAAPAEDRSGWVEGVDGELHAGTLDDPIPIDIDFLGAWPFEMREDPFPEHVKAIDGRIVRIQGFMLPDVDFQHIREWHLVRSLWGCCFGAPPRINEIVLVRVPGEGMDYTYNTLEVVGRMDVVYEVEDGIVLDLYRIDAERIRELGFEDPDAPLDFDPATGFTEGFLPSSY